jgi:hypothetical protein
VNVELAEAQKRNRKPGRPRKVSPSPEAALRLEPARRLLDLNATAAYLNVSPWTVRDLEAAGVLRRVRVPLTNGGELRKVLFDREDLDRLIVSWKGRPA